jgi:hypothetical protein
MTLVSDSWNIRLAVLGMSEGNGHPYSWSAIFNGYDPEAMAQSGYPGILEYLNAEPKASFGVPGVRVTHVWCPERDDSEKVSRASLVPHIAESPEDLIGEVDAVIIATDVGGEHLKQAEPFLDAGVPIFIDKPLTDEPEDLAEFVRLDRLGKPFLSSSCMRYAREYEDRLRLLEGVGELRLVTMTMCKSWERYGIHALEAVYGFLSPGGWVSVRNTGTESRNIVHLTHCSGVDVLLGTISDLYGAFGCLGLFGTQGCLNLRFKDTFYAFKKQLEDFVSYLRTGQRPFPFAETVELVTMLLAGLESRRKAGQLVFLSEFRA